MRIYNKIGTKERLIEMMEKVNKIKINESQMWGEKINNESFDSPIDKDKEYLDKTKGDQTSQVSKYDDGTRYPVEKNLKVKDPSLEKLKGDDAPIEECEGCNDENGNFTDGAEVGETSHEFSESEDFDLSVDTDKDESGKNASASNFREMMKQKYGVEDTSDLTPSQYRELMASMNTKDDVKDTSTYEISPEDRDRIKQTNDKMINYMAQNADQIIDLDTFHNVEKEYQEETGEKMMNPMALLAYIGRYEQGSEMRNRLANVEELLIQNTDNPNSVRRSMKEDEDIADQDIADENEPINNDIENGDISMDMGFEDQMDGGLADDAMPSEFNPEQIVKGIKIEMEHTNDPKIALEVTMDHLSENPSYYDHLENMENDMNDGSNEEECEDCGNDIEDEKAPEDALLYPSEHWVDDYSAKNITDEGINYPTPLADPEAGEDEYIEMMQLMNGEFGDGEEVSSDMNESMDSINIESIKNFLESEGELTQGMDIRDKGNEIVIYSQYGNGTQNRFSPELISKLEQNFGEVGEGDNEDDDRGMRWEYYIKK